MNVTEVNKMLAHLLDGIDTEHPDIEDVWLFNNRFVEAVNAMPVGTRFTDGKLPVEKISETAFRISFPGTGCEDTVRNNSIGSGGIGCFWSMSFGEWTVDFHKESEPLIPNGSLKFKLIEEE